MNNKLTALLTLLLTLFLLAQPVISGDYIKPIITLTPELERVTIDGNLVYVEKGTKEPYTGTTSLTNSYRDDVVVKQKYVDGLPDDRKIFYHTSGVKIKGELVFQYPDGSKHSSIRLTRGILHGVSKSWYPSGVLEFEGHYTVGSMSTYTSYYESGNKKRARIRVSSRSKETVSWYESGNKKSSLKANNKGIILASKQWDSKGRKHGLWIERYDDGSMLKEKHYTNGDPTSRWTTWYRNGKRQTEVHFTDGLLDGSIRHWNKEGVLVVDGQFEDSKEVGPWIFKDNDGNSIRRPKDLAFDITDDGRSIMVIRQDDNRSNNMETFYVSIYMPLAIAMLVLLPLLGAGIAVYALRRRR